MICLSTIEEELKNQSCLQKQVILDLNLIITLNKKVYHLQCPYYF